MNTADAPDYVGKFNAFRHQDGLPSPKDASIRRKSYDAPFSWAWLDLRGEPMVVQMPAIPAGRFVVMQFYDLWGHNLAHVDAKNAATKALSIWSPGPPGRARNPRASIASCARYVARRHHGPHRSAAPGDAASVGELQKQYRIVPFSQFAKVRP
jgi:hypothetical protein